ncbi:hypothetical protein SAMN05421736_112149 [Evansella caseinilytica]|uniref:Uncharacterized protein n=1 Tax=Evansella caseinilytica TaxID=1503961 RepID=A0A1H3T0E9_9BACI|nr:hypothetical protein [Evansella caseinilytica]SDZ43301.1 hypothetical protein SAMN05421736_112149 [Evansella caseinilytica]
MPYHKNKRQAFEAAQQAYTQLQEAFLHLHEEDADYGHHHKMAEQELDEAIQVIRKAQVTASEHQKKQLDMYSREVERYKQQLME